MMLASLALVALTASSCPEEPLSAPEQESAAKRTSLIAAYLETEGLPVSRGFARPRGRSSGCAWAVAKGTITAPSHGQVQVAEDRLVLTAIAYRNHRRHRVELTWSGGLRPSVKNQRVVQAGEKLASAGPTALTVAVDGRPLSARVLFRDWKTLFDPHAEERLVIVDQGSRELYFRRGDEERRLRVGFGQAPGKKVQRGDNKSPRGMYFVTHRHRGAFGQPYADYYGGHWVKVSYPNAFDARRGLEAGWLTRKQAADIAASWRRRKLPNQKTRLGGGIGFHGWIDEWSDAEPWLSWGCLVMHNADIRALYDELTPGTMVILL